MVEVKSTELLEHAKYISNPMVTDHFHVTVNQGLVTRFLASFRPRRFVFKILNFFFKLFASFDQSRGFHVLKLFTLNV